MSYKMPRYARQRDQNESIIVDELRRLGAHVDLLDKPVDLLVGYHGVTILVEVKQPGKKPSKTQEDWLRDWPGGRRHVVWTTADAEALLADIDEQKRREDLSRRMTADVCTA